MTPASRKEAVAISPGVRETESEDGAVLLDVEQGVCFSLNAVGLRIWNLLRQGHNAEQIADALANDYDVPRPQLLEDAQKFIAELEANRLASRHDIHDPMQTKIGFWSKFWRRGRSA